MQRGSNYCTCLIASSSEDDYCDSPLQRYPYSRSACLPRNSSQVLRFSKSVSSHVKRETRRLNSRRAYPSAGVAYHSFVGTKLHKEVKLNEDCICPEAFKTKNHSSAHHRNKHEATFVRTKYSSDVESSENSELEENISNKLCGARKKRKNLHSKKTAAITHKNVKKSSTAVAGRESRQERHRQGKQRHHSRSSDNSLVVLYKGEGKFNSSLSSSSCYSASFSTRKLSLVKSATIESQVHEDSKPPTTAKVAAVEITSVASAAWLKDKSKTKNKGSQNNIILNDWSRIENRQRRETQSPSRLTQKLDEQKPLKSRLKPLVVNERLKDNKSRRHRAGGTITDEFCRRPDSSGKLFKPLLHCPNSPVKKQKSQDNFQPDFGLLAQHLCGKKCKAIGNNSTLNIDDSQRLFPFKETRSGNLKIVPNQVVFDSKKVSILVAEPRNAKVNVKSEQARVKATDHVPQLELSSAIDINSSDYQHCQKSQQQYYKLLAPSQLVKFAACRESQRFNQSQMQAQQQPVKNMKEPQQDIITHPTSVIDDMPLSSLGFTIEQPIDWKNIVLPEKTDLYKEIARRITTYKNADCIVRIENDEFHCHLLVLQSYSTYFDDKNVKEINLTGSSVTSRVFSIIYDWMLSTTRDSCQLLKRDNILEVFLASQFLGIKELEEQCWAFIDNDELFCEDTAFLLYLEARKIENTAVMELMLPRIMKFFLMLVSTKDFLELTVQELCLLLRSNYICVNSEMEVLMSAVRWLMHDWENRKQHLLEVMRCIRFGLIAPWQLVDVKRNPENPEFMELMSYPEVQQMVDDGLAYVIIKYWYSNQTEDYYHWIDLLGLVEPTNRNWTGEDKHYVTYKEFLLYLEDYQKTKITEFKNKKFVKPVPLNVTKKEDISSQTSSAKPRTNHQNSRIIESSHATSSLRPSKHVIDMPTSNTSQAVPPCMMMSPEILCQYFSNIGRNGTKPVNKSTNSISRRKTENKL